MRAELEKETIGALDLSRLIKTWNLALILAQVLKYRTWKSAGVLAQQYQRFILAKTTQFGSMTDAMGFLASQGVKPTKKNAMRLVELCKPWFDRDDWDFTRKIMGDVRPPPKVIRLRPRR